MPRSLFALALAPALLAGCTPLHSSGELLAMDPFRVDRYAVSPEVVVGCYVRNAKPYLLDFTRADQIEWIRPGAEAIIRFGSHAAISVNGDMASSVVAGHSEWPMRDIVSDRMDAVQQCAGITA